MDLRLSPGDLAFRSEVRGLIAATFPDHRPREQDPDDERRWHAALVARGWAANKWPTAFGGPGWTPTQNFIWERETTSAGLPPQVGGMGMGMLAPILFGFGSKAQQDHFLPDILEGRVRWCQGYSEPGAGSDLASLRTAAVRDGEAYVVDGEKIWTSGAHQADWMFCLTRTATGEKKQQGITFLLIDMRSPGVTVHPIVSIDGRHAFNRVTFDSVRVPAANRIGEEGQGWTYAKGLLTHERTGQAFVSLSLQLLAGIQAAAAGTGAGDGASLFEDRAFRAKLAAVEVELRALEITELRTLSQVAAGEAPGAQSSMLKLKGTEIIQRLTELYMECAGAYAAPWLPQIVHLGANLPPVGPAWAGRETIRYLEGRAASIAGGTDEVQRDIIARRILRV